MPEPSFSISQVSTLQASFAEDVEAYAAAGAGGIGIWEMKLPQGDDAESLALVRDGGLEVTNCVPAIPSILPLPLMDGPVDPRERIEAVCASIRRLAAVRAAEHRLPHRPAGRARRRRGATGSWSTACAGSAARRGRRAYASGSSRSSASVPRTGRSRPRSARRSSCWTRSTTPALGITFDVWNLWNGATILDDIREHAGRFTGVHVSDWREPTRGWCDRVLPGRRRRRPARDPRRARRGGLARSPTTSRSSRTTAPSGTTTKGRCGGSPHRSWPGGAVRRSRRYGGRARRACTFDLRRLGVL